MVRPPLSLVVKTKTTTISPQIMGKRMYTESQIYSSVAQFIL